MASLPAENGIAQTSGATVLRVATTLTSSYVATTNSCKTVGFNRAVFGIGYIKGSETNALVKLEGYDGTTWRALGYADAPSSGVRELTKQVLQLTPANYDADDAVASPPMDLTGFHEVRASVKYSGGSAPGTIAISVTMSNEVAGR